MMDLRISFRAMKHSVALENYVKDEAAKIEKFLKREHGPINCDVVLDAGHGHNTHKVEIRLSSKHYNLIAHDEGSDCYDVITSVARKIVAELKKHKEKALSKRNHPEHTIKDPVE